MGVVMASSRHRESLPVKYVLSCVGATVAETGACVHVCVHVCIHVCVHVCY